jgi:urease gamma subunit
MIWSGRHAARQRKDGAKPHEHLMNQGAPVLWRDAISGQLDRLAMESSEQATFADGEPF